MFRLTIAAAATLLSWSSLGQGTVVFNNRVPSPGIDAPVSRCDGTGAGAGVNAQLFLVSASGLATSTPLFPATTFRTIGGPAAAYYVLPPQTPVSVPGIRAGEDATIVMRAWEGASYDTATVRGQSVPITITLGTSVNTPGGFQSYLVGLQGFNLCIPEPSPVALLAFAAAACRLSCGARRFR